MKGSIDRSRVFLLEDDAASAARRHREGVSTSAVGRTIRMAVHELSESGGWTKLASARYSAGRFRRERDGRAKFALSLIDRVGPPKKSILVAGASFGSVASLVRGLAARHLPFLLQVRPSRKVVCVPSLRSATVADLLADASWVEISPARWTADSTITGAGLGIVAIPGEPRVAATLLAMQPGGIAELTRGTIAALSSEAMDWDDAAPLLMKAREFRQSIRRRQASSGNGAGVRTRPKGQSRKLKVRANITLGRKQDRRGTPEDHAVPGRGIVAGRRRVLNVVELFAGAGGLGLGLLLAEHNRRRYRIVFSGEVSPIFARTLANNHRTLEEIKGAAPGSLAPRDTRHVDLRDAQALKLAASKAKSAGKVDLIVGGPPCQGFSMANRNSWRRENPNNRLIDVFLRYVEAMEPSLFLVENVQGILWTGRERTQVAVVDAIESRMRRAGYTLHPKLLDAAWYGVPQHRNRFFLLGIHKRLGYPEDAFGEWGPFPRPTHGPGLTPYTTVRQALRDLPQIGNGAGQASLPYRQPRASLLNSNDFLAFVRSDAPPGSISDHITSRHADYVIDRYKQIPPGGNWESIRHLLTNYSDVGRTHSNIYRRLKWDEPAVTIGHYRKAMLVHPSQDRGLSLREASRLQSFPDWFRFAGSKNGSPGGLMHKQQQLANAVCPLLTKHVAETLLRL